MSEPLRSSSTCTTVVPPPDHRWAAALSPRERELCTGAGEWAGFVDRVLAAMPPSGTRPGEPLGPGPERLLAHPLRHFLTAARHRLEQRLYVAGPGTGAAEVDLPAVWADVARWLEGRLAELAARTLVRELHRQRTAGRLRGADGRERFADFLRWLDGRVELTGLLARYPVLARLLGECCLRTVDAVAEALLRLAADRPRLIADLLDGVDPGRLTGLGLGGGDVHAGGRAVMVLRFGHSGTRVVYKPRPLGLHRRWNELLGWFAGLRPGLAPRAVRVLAMDGYGWAEFIPSVPCASPAAVEVFYRRQGALLALLYALDATDIHCENLIACGDQPVVVDVETLFHPGWTPRTDGGHDPALAAVQTSVMRTALLPRLLLGEHGALDLSALGGDNDADYPTDLARWTDAGTDLMRLVRDRAQFAGGANRPELDGAAIDPLLHRDNLLGGFRTAYATIAAHAGELCGPAGPLAGFAGEQIRLVMRNTQTYASLLAESTHPDLLGDGLERERAFASLYAETGHEHLRALPPFEVADLFSGDVPLFTAEAGSTDVHTADGHRLPGLLHTSGIQAARDKIDRMGAVDLRAQEWLVDATLATKHTAITHRAGAPLSGAVASEMPDQQHLLSLARGIGDELIAHSRQDGQRANWLGLELVDGRHWSVLPMGAGLAEGYCGTALFLAQLGALTGTSRYLDLAARAVRPLPVLIDLLAAHPELAVQVGAGGFFGLGGICYATARLAGLLGDSALAGCLPTAIAATEAAARADTENPTGGPAGPAELSVGEGTAGALAALLAVHAETGLPAAAGLAETLATRLATRPAPELGGFLHGRHGVDWALRRFAAVTGTPARQPEPELDTERETDPGWCSGLAGIVLAGRDGTAAGTDESAWRLTAALTEHAPARDQSLCHGLLGSLDALVELAGQGYEPAVAALPRAGARLAGALARHGVQCGTPRGVPTPGLLSGTAGIGFGLLRLAFTDRVPSVLLLRPARPGGQIPTTTAG